MNFGDFFENILSEMGMSSYKLSKIRGISQSQLSRIRKSENAPSIATLLDISNALGVNLSEYYKVAYLFNTLEEYIKYIEVRRLVEDNQIIELETLLKQIDINNINSDGPYFQVICHAKALILVRNKQYNKAEEFCYMGLGIKNKLFKPTELEKYIHYEVSYTEIGLLSVINFHLKNYEKAIDISSNLISVIEKIYFNDNIRMLEIPKIVFRVYIISINNMADTLFNLKKYQGSLEVCEKGLEILEENNSTIALASLLELAHQNNYALSNFNESKKFHNRAIHICKGIEDYGYLERMTKRTLENYKENLY